MFNIVDLAVVVALLFFIFRGYENGFLAGLLNFVSTAVSFTGAIIFYPALASVLNLYFTIGTNAANVIGFFSLLLVLEVIISILDSIVYKLFFISFLRFRFFSLMDKFLGIFPALFVGSLLLFTTLLLPIILPYDVGLRTPVKQSWVGQNVLPWITLLEPGIEKLINRLPTQSLFFIITPSPVSHKATKLNFPSDLTLTPDSIDETRMLALLNKERIERGLKPLKSDPEIAKVARAYSNDMFVRGYFSHYNPENLSAFERMSNRNIKFISAGENLAYAPTA